VSVVIDGDDGDFDVQDIKGDQRKRR